MRVRNITYIVTLLILFSTDILYARAWLHCVDGQSWLATETEDCCGISNVEWTTAGGCALGPWIVELSFVSGSSSSGADEVMNILHDIPSQAKPLTLEQKNWLPETVLLPERGPLAGIAKVTLDLNLLPEHIVNNLAIKTTPVSVPTISEWGLILLALCLVLIAMTKLPHHQN